ncbi:hypothetical protein ZIOFF_071270 [Zingiber officinale]|uniref:Uncharacterized protein n=1 Tax=Zingiber officinale TaxID=94328 RepID=A0A8J5C120_ZINOF|nr:hypothetical protein ZIOFF_071270 [Zingiber officinale]
MLRRSTTTDRPISLPPSPPTLRQLQKALHRKRSGVSCLRSSCLGGDSEALRLSSSRSPHLFSFFLSSIRSVPSRLWSAPMLSSTGCFRFSSAIWLFSADLSQCWRWGQEASSDDNAGFMIDMLKECGLSHKSIIFILDEFDLFAQGK